MDDSQRRAYQALGLGPAWALREGFARHSPSAVTEAASAAASDAAATAQPATEAVIERVTEAVSVAVPGAETVGATEDVLSLDEVRARVEELRARVAGCRDCRLCETRTQTVFGVGTVPSRWLFVGEAPGAEEDARGEPFVGQAGRLLDAMLAAIGLSREEDVFIANVLKCRPPGNRNPEPDEVRRCEPFLLRQVELVAPRVIVVLGRFAAQSLLGTDASIAGLRGRVHRYRAGGREIPLVVTYHPAYLLRSLADKSKAWADLCLARATMEAAGPD